MMRALVWIGAIIVGVIVVIGVVAAVGNGRDNTGETVRAVQLGRRRVRHRSARGRASSKAIRDELRRSNFAARQNDGGSGDSVEETISVREAVDRAIRATTDTLQEGLEARRHPGREPGSTGVGDAAHVGEQDRGEPSRRQGAAQGRSRARRPRRSRTSCRPSPRSPGRRWTAARRTGGSRRSIRRSRTRWTAAATAVT